MSARVSRRALVDLLGGDTQLVDMLEEAGVIPCRDLAPVEVENALVARTLLRELDVNMAGVEVVIRLRTELQQTRLQVRHLAQIVRKMQPPEP